MKSQLSLRIVPDQKLEAIASSLCQFLRSSFDELQSLNELRVRDLAVFSRIASISKPFFQVDINNPADWWIGELNDPWFKAYIKIKQDAIIFQPITQSAYLITSRDII